MEKVLTKGVGKVPGVQLLPQLEFSVYCSRYILIYDCLFGVNFNRNELINLDSPDYQFSIARLNNQPGNLLGGYMDLSKPLYIGNATEDNKVLSFSIPARALQDLKLLPHQVLQMNQLAAQLGFNTRVISESLTNRINRIPMEINIGGNPYLIFWADRKLVHKHDQDNQIDLDRCTRVLGTGGFQFYYNLKTNQVVELHPRLTKFPQDVVSVTLPEGRILDPVGLALEQGRRAGYYLAGWLARDQLVATISSLHQTPIPELVRRNQIEQEAHAKPGIKTGGSLSQPDYQSKSKKHGRGL